MNHQHLDEARIYFDLPPCSSVAHRLAELALAATHGRRMTTDQQQPQRFQPPERITLELRTYPGCPPASPTSSGRS